MKASVALLLIDTKFSHVIRLISMTRLDCAIATGNISKRPINGALGAVTSNSMTGGSCAIGRCIKKLANYVVCRSCNGEERCDIAVACSRVFGDWLNVH